jgi:hypothetical protein
MTVFSSVLPAKKLSAMEVTLRPAKVEGTSRVLPLPETPVTVTEPLSMVNISSYPVSVPAAAAAEGQQSVKSIAEAKKADIHFLIVILLS